MTFREERDMVSVQTVEEVRALPAGTRAVLVAHLDDDKLRALAQHPALRTILSDGNSRATDEGVRAIAGLPELEVLDLEWSDAVTDQALTFLYKPPKLSWIDLTGCARISARAIASLRTARPGIEIEPLAV